MELNDIQVDLELMTYFILLTNIQYLTHFFTNVGTSRISLRTITLIRDTLLLKELEHLKLKFSDLCQDQLGFN